MTSQAASQKSMGLRTPRITEDVPRGLSSEFKVALPVPQSSEDFVKKFDPLSVEVQQALTAVLMLESPETNIVVDSLNALQKFLKKCDENKELSSVVHKAKLFIRDMELVKDLLTLAEGKDDVVTEYAAYALSNVATLHTGRLQIVQKEGVPILIALFAHVDPDVQRNALETIWQLAADPLQIGLLINEECTGAVLKLVDSEYPPLQAIALLTLEKIAGRLDGIVVLESLDTFNVLADKLKNETMVDIHRYCLKIFYHECRDRGTCKKFASLVPAVAEIIDRTQDGQARVNGLELLGRMCSIEQIARGLAECGIPQLLCSMISSEEADAQLKEACAFATAQIARSAYTAKAKFIKAIPALLDMVLNETTGERGLKCGLIALASIVEDTANVAGEFILASGFEVYKKLLGKHESNSDDVVLSALTAIDTIASPPDYRIDLVRAEFLPVLITLFQNSKNPQIHATISSIVCSILCETATHEEFCKLQGPEVLLNIISHEEFPVVVAIIPVIIIASADPALGKELLDKGLLQTMWARADLISSGPIRACFDRLISANLTLKYAITRNLTPFERLETGFCDIGGLKLMDKLKLPQDFKWDGRDPRQKVILLHTGTDKLDPAVMQNNASLQDTSHIADIIETVKSQRESVENDISLVEIIARAVSDRFGGPLDKWRITAKTEDIEIENIQTQHKSVIVPINLLGTGAFRVRAMVFKAICDVVGVPCSLETSDYKKAWNVVLLRPDENYPMMCSCIDDNENSSDNFGHTENLRKYVVDLVFQPGFLMPLKSFEAETYITAH